MSIRMSRKSDILSYEEALKLADEYAEEEKREKQKKLDEFKKFKQQKLREKEEVKRRTQSRIEELEYMAKQTSQRSVQSRQRVERRKQAIQSNFNEDGSRKRVRGKKTASEPQEEAQDEGNEPTMKGRYKSRGSSQPNSKGPSADEGRTSIATKGKYSSQKDTSEPGHHDSQHSSMPAKIKVKSLSQKDTKPASESTQYREVDEDTDYDEGSDNNEKSRKVSKGSSAGRSAVSSVISQMFGRSYYSRANDESDDDMEVSASQIRREEFKSARIGREEDELEEERLEQMARKKKSSYR